MKKSLKGWTFYRHCIVCSSCSFTFQRGLFELSKVVILKEETLISQRIHISSDSINNCSDSPSLSSPRMHNSSHIEILFISVEQLKSKSSKPDSYLSLCQLYFYSQAFRSVSIFLSRIISADNNFNYTTKGCDGSIFY